MHCRPPRPLLRLLAAIVAGAILVVGPTAVDAQERQADDGTLAADLVQLARDPSAGPVDVTFVFRDQPATTAAQELRPLYAARIDAVRAPALAALARIDELLPPRGERAELGVAGVMSREAALLTPEEREILRSSRDRTVELVLEMRRTVLDAAWAETMRIQQPLVDRLTARPDSRVWSRLVVLNAVTARVRPADLPALVRGLPDLALVDRCRTRHVDMNNSVGAIGAASWTAAAYNGSGQRVAIVDTGVDTTHPAFALSGGGNLVVASTVELETVKNSGSFNDDATSTDDLHGHGTHLSGTVASQDGTYGGVAPGTSLLNAKCFFRTTNNNGSASDPDIYRASDWALTNGATVMNLSFGGGGTTNGTNSLTIFYDAAVDVAGAAVAVAAGNSGSGAGTVGVPGDAFNAITVGAFNDRNTAAGGNDSLAGFSSRGPTSDGRRKPDLSAPGVGIQSASNRWETAADFRSSNGTSMATPHVAGALALLLDYNAPWQPEALKALLTNSVRNSAPVTTTPDNNWGYGALDLAQAYTDRTLVQTGTFSSSGADALYFTLSNVAVGDRTTLAWNRVASFSSAGRRSGAGAATALVNLDLGLYDGADASTDVESASTIESVEQIKAAAALSTAVLKVKRAGSFPSGQTSVSFALAPTGALTVATPPALTLAFDAPPDVVPGGGALQLTAALTNTGGLLARAPSANLVLPAGWSFAAGESPNRVFADSVPTASGGTAQRVTWDVVAGDVTGEHQVTATAFSISYGESFDAVAAATDVTVDATSPVADAGDDLSLLATSADGRTLTLDGSGSSDDSGLAVALAWDLDADGDFGDDGGSATGATPDVTLEIGEHDITLRATDHVGNLATDHVRMTIRNNAPVATAGDDRTSDEGELLAFDGGASADLEGVVTHAWDFGDGRTALGAAPTHTFRDDGVYTVTLTVTDTHGDTADDTLDVTVSNRAPLADAGIDRSVDEGAVVQFAGMASDPGVDDVLEFRWTFGDGTASSAETPAHVFRQNGTYTVTLRVTDDDGLAVSDTLTVIVGNLPPVAEAGPLAGGVEGSSVAFRGSALDPGPDDVLTYFWEFGDGAVGSGSTPSHVYAQDGLYTARLTVRDDSGATHVDTTPVNVLNRPPSLTLPDGLVRDVGAAVDLQVQPFDPSPDDAAALVITWLVTDGDGTALAVGIGAHVGWHVDRKFEGTLEVRVADDDSLIVRTASLVGVTPPVGDATGPILALALEPKAERTLLRRIARAQDLLVSAATDPRRLKKVRKEIDAARRVLAKIGASESPLARRLDVLSDDLSEGLRPPDEVALMVPSTLGSVQSLLVALPRAEFDARTRRKLGDRLLELRFAERSGVSAKRRSKLQRKALKTALQLGPSAQATWFTESLLAL